MEIRSVDRLPGTGIRHRRVVTTTGEKWVSMIDGYRVMYAYPGESFFANLKVETSASSEYVDDKAVVSDGLRQLSRNSVSIDHHGSFELQTIDKRSIDTRGPIKLSVLFRDPTRTIVTIYFISQDAGRRHYRTLDEFEQLSARFIRDYIACVDHA
jgi:hypothetical protein